MARDPKERVRTMLTAFRTRTEAELAAETAKHDGNWCAWARNQLSPFVYLEFVDMQNFFGETTVGELKKLYDNALEAIILAEKDCQSLPAQKLEFEKALVAATKILSSYVSGTQ